MKKKVLLTAITAAALTACFDDGASTTAPSTGSNSTSGATCSYDDEEYQDGATRTETSPAKTATYKCENGKWLVTGSATTVSGDKTDAVESSSSEGDGAEPAEATSSSSQAASETKDPVKPASSSSAKQSSSSSAVKPASSSSESSSGIQSKIPHEIIKKNAFAQTWYGSDAIYRIETGFEDGSDKSGYWIELNDHADGGKSSIKWPVELGNDYYELSFDPVIDYCSGVCGEYTLDKGTMSFNPYVGVYFNLAGEPQDGVEVAADVSEIATGICIAYTSDNAAVLEMGLFSDVEDSIGYDNPFVSLPKSSTGNVKSFTWDKFKQAGWGKMKITGPEAAKQLVSLRFKVQAASGTKGSFSITAVSYESYCGYAAGAAE